MLIKITFEELTPEVVEVETETETQPSISPAVPGVAIDGFNPGGGETASSTVGPGSPSEAYEYY